MAKTVIFVCHPSDVQFALRERPKQPENSVVIVTLNEQLGEEFARTGLEYRVLQDYASSDGDANLRKKTVLWIDEWAEGCLSRGKTVKELFCVEGFSLWWFALPVLFPDVLRCIQFVDLVCNVLDREVPQRVFLSSGAQALGFPMRLNLDPNLPGAVIDLVCRSRGIVTANFGTTSMWLGRYLKLICVRLGFAVYNKCGRVAIGIFRRTLAYRPRAKNVRPGNKTVVVFSSPVYWRQCMNDDGTIEFNDAIAGNCISELKHRKYDLLGIDTEVNVPTRERVSVVREKTKRSDINWKVIEQFENRFSISLYYKHRKLVGGIRAAWSTDRVWRAGLNYRGVALDGLLRGRFDYLFKFYFVEVLSCINAIERIVLNVCPKLFLLVYEESAYGRAATIVGQRRGIPTMGLQHGTLAGPFLPSYFFREVSLNVRNNPTACPIPNCTAVYGQRTKDMLTEVSAYPSGSVSVVGMPSFDRVFRVQKQVRTDWFLEKLGVTGGKPIILVVDQPMFNRENRIAYISTILDVALEFQDVKWVVKLHPSGSAADWESAIRIRKLKGIHIAQGNVHMWLMVCTVMVAWHSTTMLEGALLGKSVYAVYIAGCPNAEMYVADGIAVRVDDSAELLSHLRRRREGKKLGVGSGLSRGLESHVYKPDGNASVRVADVVDSLILTPYKDTADNDCTDRVGE